MTPSGKDHREPVTVRSFDNFVVAYGAAWLNDGRDPGFGERFYAVGEGEEGVARGGGALCPFAGFLYGYLRRVDPAHLARSYADRGPFSSQDYGVALDHTGYAPGEDKIFPLLRRRMCFGDDFVLRVVLDVVCCFGPDPAGHVLG